MKNILEEMIAKKISELKKRKTLGPKILNMIKGDPLHFIILDFLYSHKIYKNCVMYGGSALKIIYGLPRMSVDLDFQINFSLDQRHFEQEIINYFRDQYGYKNLGAHVGTEDKETVVVKITFSGLDKFKIPDINFTTLKVRLDFNKFDTDNFQQILVSGRNSDVHCKIRTYPVSTLMASKIVAVLSRVQYGIPGDDGKSILANYKGRDIYDLIWYLQKGVIPHLGYLRQRGHVFDDYPDLFKKIKERVKNLGDGGKALRTDLTHLYFDPKELDEWMNKWNRFFLDSLQNYFFITIGKLKQVRVIQDFDSGNFIFQYRYKTDQEKIADFRVEVSENYIEDFPINGFKRDDIMPQIGSHIGAGEEKTVIEYAGLFYSKIEDFLKRIHHISPRLKIGTKLIAYIHHGDYDPDTIVSLTNKELERCQFEDFL